MAITRAVASSITQGLPKQKTLLAGNSTILPGSYESIATVTVGAGGQSTVTFSSIPDTYKHLQVRLFAKYTGVGYGYMRFNGDSSSNYSSHGIHGNGASGSPLGTFGSGTTTASYYTNAAGTKDTTFNVSIIDVLNYSNTNQHKTTKGFYGWDANGTGYVELNSGNWRNTAAITSIVLSSSAGNFSEYSVIALYGVK